CAREISMCHVETSMVQGEYRGCFGGYTGDIQTVINGMRPRTMCGLLGLVLSRRTSRVFPYTACSRMATSWSGYETIAATRFNTRNASTAHSLVCRCSPGSSLETARSTCAGDKPCVGEKALMGRRIFFRSNRGAVDSSSGCVDTDLANGQTQSPDRMKVSAAWSRSVPVMPAELYPVPRISQSGFCPRWWQ